VAETVERVGSYGDVQPPTVSPPIAVPGDVERCIHRGRKRMLEKAAKRRLCDRMEQGETFHYIDISGLLQSKAVVTNPRGGGKPPHRSRRKFNFIRPVVDEKVSAATQRIPGYEVDPSTTDPEDAGGAKLSEKVAIYGYDQWRIRKATLKAVKTAIGKGGSAFVLPYFEPNVGPYVMTPDGPIGTGEIRVKVFNGNEVYWEPGCSFEHSPWWVTEQAQPVSLVRELEGFVGGPLAPDASSSDVPAKHPEGELMIVRNYYERPCPKWPNGRWFTSANNRVIVDNRLIDPTSEYPWQDYPLQDADGTVLDEPLIHPLFWDPEDEDDLGLTWQLIDFQLAAQDCLNKMLEYKNLGLNVQMIAPVDSLIDRPDDVPGAVKYYKPDPIHGLKPEWADAPSGQILNALLQIFNLISGQMQMVGSFQDIQADANVAARTGQLAIEQSHARWQTFLGDLAEWHSRLMRHCLLLTSRYYTEPRLLAIRGRMGWESIKDFRGSHLLGQTNVRVFPGSLEYLSRAQVTARAQYYASMGWISGTQTMEAIESGDLGPVTEAYEDDKARINRIIQRIRDGSIMQMPTRTQEVPAIDPTTGAPAVDPLTGQPRTIEQDVPAWMPDEYDTLPVWEEQLALWLKSDDFERSPPEAQGIGKMMWQGLQQLKASKAAQDARQQQQMAQSLGMGNAAAPQGPPALPSLPNVAAGGSADSAGPSGGQPAPPSPNPQG
jgi:hypothetical protein